MPNETDYRIILAHDAQLVVRFATERGYVLTYRVVLLALHEGEWEAVRVYDNVHGRNEMHRYTDEGVKEDAETFSEASAAEALRQAREEALANYREIIDSWKL
jgi:hypothetical protein